MKIIFGMLAMMGLAVLSVGMASVFFDFIEELDDFIEKQERRAERRKGKE